MSIEARCEWSNKAMLECSGLWERCEGCSSVRGTEVVVAVQKRTKMVTVLRQAQRCCNSTEAAERAQDSSKGSFSIRALLA